MIKKLAYTLLTSAMVLSLSGCNFDQTTTDNANNTDKDFFAMATPANDNANKTDASANAVATPAKADTLTFQQKVAVAVGTSYGDNLSKGVDQANLLGFDLDKSLLSESFSAAVNGKPQMTTEEAQQVLQEFDTQMRTKAAEQQKKDGEAAKAAGEQFLAQNGKKEGVVTTSSGLQYEILTQGTGPKPTATDTVKVNYKGTTIDGVVFDESKEPVEFPLNQVIKGWTEGLQLLNVGTKARLVVPASLAYGEFSPTEKIKPNSTLVFEVELLGIQGSPAEAPAEKK